VTRFIPHAIFAALVVFAIGWAAILTALVPLPDGPNDFNSPGFIVKHSWVKFALLATRPVRGEPSGAEEDALVARFFDLNQRIERDEQTGGQGCSTPEQASAAREDELHLRDERRGIENQVELILEGRLTRAIKQAGLTRHVGGDIVWPPVNSEFEDPPAVLVKSPRSESRIESESLLQGDLPIERVQQIEANAERDGETSALVVQIGGIAMYPAIIPPSGDYRFVLRDIAHEWTHHYLAFTPLGRHYNSLRGLNETVANIVGDDLGALLAQEYPLGKPPSYVTAAPLASAGAPRSASRQDDVDFNAEMHALRLQVDMLLAAGRVDDAEAAMDAKQQFFAAHGICIREINQAFFAFNGTYADQPESSDPIGPKLASLRAEEPTLRAFVETVRAFTSAADLDRALAAPP
jgi:hypothetical protein